MSRWFDEVDDEVGDASCLRLAWVMGGGALEVARAGETEQLGAWVGTSRPTAVTGRHVP
jgi:hypothetical protein